MSPAEVIAKVLERYSIHGAGPVLVRGLEEAGFVIVPKELTGEMWARGRDAFVKAYAEVGVHSTYEMQSAHSDRAPEAIYQAVIEARPK